MENKTIHTMIVNVENSTFTVTPPLDIHQGDRNSHILLIKLRNNGNKFISIDEDVVYKIFFYRSSDKTLIESEDVNVENYYRGILSYVLGPTVMSDFGRYTCTLRGYLNDEIISSISFPITVSKAHNYTARTNEIAMTKDFYNKLNEHMDDIEIHLQEIDRDFIDTFNDQVDALLKTIRDNEFVKELELNSTPKDITSLSQGVYLVLTEGEIKLPASDLDDQSIPVSTTLSQGSIIYVNDNSYNVISDKESYSISKVLSTGFYKYKLGLDEKTKRGILKDIEDLKEGKQESLTPGDGIDIDKSTGEISVDDTIARVENVNKSLDKKVDKVEGKDLSTNDFTDSYKEILDSLPEELSKKQDADKLVKDQFIDESGSLIEGVTRDNYISAEAAQDGLQKLYAALDSVKQDKLDASNAGSNITITIVDGVLKINARPGISILFFDSKDQFPTNYDDVDFNSFYFCKAPGEGEEFNTWEEYFPIGDAEHRTVKYELLGTTKIDLSDYYKKSEINTFLDNKVDKVEGKQLSTNDFTNSDKDITNAFTIVDGKLCAVYYEVNNTTE